MPKGLNAAALLLESARAMSRKNHDKPLRKDAAQREPEAAEGQPLWAWLGHSRDWSLGQAGALAMLASLAICLLVVTTGQDGAMLPAAKGFAVLAYGLMGFVLCREAARSFRCE